MGTRNVRDAVDALFVRCIACNDSMKAFGKAAAMVHRLARDTRRENLAHLACALDEQHRFLQLVRAKCSRQATEHRILRDRELNAFYRAQRRD